MQASDGNLYGTTLAGGVNTCRGSDQIPCGAIYRITPAGDETVIYSFGASPTDGYTPGMLRQGRDGALYGVTTSGGEHGAGTFFRITLDGVYKVIYSFGSKPADGAVPGRFLQAEDGNFYGVTATGGANHSVNIPQAGGNCGTAYKLTPEGEETVLYSFGNQASDGIQPAAIILAADGNFYGTTSNGGANDCGAPNSCGTIFKMTREGLVTTLHSFGATAQHGIIPTDAFFQGRDGAFYGTTIGGGRGTVFRMAAMGALTVLHAFADTSPEEGDGPASLVQGSDGNLYGTTNSGGKYGGSLAGTIFRVTPAGGFATVYSFGPLNQKPSSPHGLFQGADGAFYGMVAYNGTLGATGQYGGAGAVFRMVVR